jgi:hypothetical protein
MTEPSDAFGVDPLAEFQLTAAKFVLGLAQSWDIPPAADRALSSGMYSDSLAELSYLKDATRRDVESLLRKAFAECNLKAITKTDAAWAVARHCIQRIANGSDHPFAPLELVRDVNWASTDVLPNVEHVGSGLDVGLLIGIYWSYTEPNENYHEAEQRVLSEDERQRYLDREARREARAWLSRHPDRNP